MFGSLSIGITGYSVHNVPHWPSAPAPEAPATCNNQSSTLVPSMLHEYQTSAPVFTSKPLGLRLGKHLRHQKKKLKSQALLGSIWVLHFERTGCCCLLTRFPVSFCFFLLLGLFPFQHDRRPVRSPGCTSPPGAPAPRTWARQQQVAAALVFTGGKSRQVQDW